VAINEEAEAYRDEYESWKESFEVYAYLENTPDNWEKVQKMDTRLVWTDHGTCEDPQITSGASMYAGKCCWDTYGWHIAKKQWDVWPDGPERTYESYKTGTYSHCPSCNPDGEEDFVESENCPGDENFPDCECNEGWINYYWD
jgi:hypothetical protein